MGAVWLWLNRGSRGAERAERAEERAWLSKCARTPALALAARQEEGRGGGGRVGVGAFSCSTLTLCQQVESVIAVPGEGVRARTPITNHRLPPLGS